MLQTAGHSVSRFSFCGGDCVWHINWVVSLSSSGSGKSTKILMMFSQSFFCHPVSFDILLTDLFLTIFWKSDCLLLYIVITELRLLFAASRLFAPLFFKFCEPLFSLVLLKAVHLHLGFAEFLNWFSYHSFYIDNFFSRPFIGSCFHYLIAADAQ